MKRRHSIVLSLCLFICSIRNLRFSSTSRARSDRHGVTKNREKKIDAQRGLRTREPLEPVHSAWSTEPRPLFSRVLWDEFCEPSVSVSFGKKGEIKNYLLQSPNGPERSKTEMGTPPHWNRPGGDVDTVDSDKLFGMLKEVNPSVEGGAWLILYRWMVSAVKQNQVTVFLKHPVQSSSDRTFKTPRLKFRWSPFLEHQASNSGDCLLKPPRLQFRWQYFSSI